MRQPVRPRLERLEARVTPVRISALAGTMLGDFSQPHTSTEVMASIRSADAIGELSRAIARDNSGSALIDPAGSRVIFTLDGDALVEVRLAPDANPAAAARWLAKQPRTVWTEPNQIFVGDPRDFTPNDPQYSAQYHLNNTGQMVGNPATPGTPDADLDVPEAWEITTGTPNIVVAIADDGLALNHPDLNGNIWVNAGETPGNGVDDDSNGFIDDVNGWDFNATVPDNNPNPSGSNSHGTHVGGIVAAETNNATGVSGIAGGDGTAGSGVRLMAIRWAGTNSWTAARIASTFSYAADNGARIVNSSYNFDGFATNTTVINAFNYSYGLGVLHLNSAGNNNQNNPARSVFTQAIMVASTDHRDVKSSFSNYGTFTDISAPGSNVLSTLTSSSGTVFTYGTNSGTSMSTPAALGVAALIWSKNPTWTREQVVAQLLATADNIDAQNPGFVGALGTGRANAARALTETIPPPKFGNVTGLPAAGAVTNTAFSTFTVFTPMRLDPAGVNTSSFELRGDGADGEFGTADDTLIPLTINSGTPYRVGTNFLTFTFSSAAMTPDRYRFIGKSGALHNPFGAALDGNGDGIAGDNFFREFGFQVPSILPTGVVTVGSGPSRSRVENLTVTFSKVVTFTNNDPLAAFSLTRTGFGPVSLQANSAVLGGQTVVTLNFQSDTSFGSLIDGRYVLSVDHTRIQDAQLTQLQPMSPTNFHRYYGDQNGDGRVDGADFVALVSTYNVPSSQAGFLPDLDYDNDDRIDGVDVGHFVTRYNVPLP